MPHDNIEMPYSKNDCVELFTDYIMHVTYMTVRDTQANFESVFKEENCMMDR